MWNHLFTSSKVKFVMLYICWGFFPLSTLPLQAQRRIIRIPLSSRYQVSKLLFLSVICTYWLIMSWGWAGQENLWFSDMTHALSYVITKSQMFTRLVWPNDNWMKEFYHMSYALWSFSFLLSCYTVQVTGPDGGSHISNSSTDVFSFSGLEAFSFDYVVKWPVSLILSKKVRIKLLSC